MLRKLSIGDEVYDLILGKGVVSCISDSSIECDFGTAVMRYGFDGVDRINGGIRRLYIGKLDINIKEKMSKAQIMKTIRGMISLTDYESVSYSQNYDVLLRTYDASDADDGEYLEEEEWETLYIVNDDDDEVSTCICLLPGLKRNSADEIVKFLIENRIRPADAVSATREILMKGLRNG